MQARGSVLLVDDEERLVKNLARALAGAGLEVTATTSPRACAALASVGMSATSRSGLVGDSIHRSRAPSHASRVASVSAMSTGRISQRPATAASRNARVP